MHSRLAVTGDVLPETWQGVGKHVLISLSVIMITGLNLPSTELIGKAENWIVGLKVAILLLFVGVGLTGIKTAQIAPVRGRRRCS